MIGRPSGGAALIEFALTAPVALLMAMGLCDLIEFALGSAGRREHFHTGRHRDPDAWRRLWPAIPRASYAQFLYLARALHRR
jgi:hypothetical protein